MEGTKIIKHSKTDTKSKNFFYLNPIPTGNRLNRPIYSYHVTQVVRNRVKPWLEENQSCSLGQG